MSCCEKQDDGLTCELTRGAPADASTFTYKDNGPTQEIARRRSQYFSEVFSMREPHNSPRDRVFQNSIIVVEIKTNAKLAGDRFQILSDLSSQLSQIYHRPEDCVLVTVEENMNLLLGSSSEPAYLMTVSGLSHLIAPVTNIRNTFLIQSAVAKILHIPASRGVIKYHSLTEENFAFNSVTMMGEIERLERESQEENPGVMRSISRRKKKLRSSQSSHLAPLPEALGTEPRIPTVSERMMQAAGAQDESRMVRKARSIRQFFSI
ncbi:Tautomerase/MIF superfamily [Elaphomyces granulatus]